jgi:hypothetical protein
MTGPHVLVVGWSSVLHGEATAGDVLAMRTVERALRAAGVSHDTAWSAVMCPPGGLALDDADPWAYSHLVFVCGPATGQAVLELHERFAHCTRIAVGVSVLDPADPAVAGFHQVIARDRPQSPPRPDLAAVAPVAPAGHLPPVLGVFLTGGQREYGARRRHETVIETLRPWLDGLSAGLLDLDTRLDPRDWRLPTAPEHLQAVIGRLDSVVTMRMHGLVLSLRSGVPVLALDPVDGGGKVTAQAQALDWPAVLDAGDIRPDTLDRALQWCLSDNGRRAAREAAMRLERSAGDAPPADDAGEGLVRRQLEDLIDALHDRPADLDRHYEHSGTSV